MCVSHLTIILCMIAITIVFGAVLKISTSRCHRHPILWLYHDYVTSRHCAIPGSALALGAPGQGRCYVLWIINPNYWLIILIIDLSSLPDYSFWKNVPVDKFRNLPCINFNIQNNLWFIRYFKHRILRLY